MGLPEQTGPSYSSSRITLHIEVRLALVATDSAAQRVHNWLSSNFTSLQVGQDVTTYSMWIQSHRRVKRTDVRSCKVTLPDRLDFLFGWGNPCSWSWWIQRRNTAVAQCRAKNPHIQNLLITPSAIRYTGLWSTWWGTTECEGLWLAIWPAGRLLGTVCLWLSSLSRNCWIASSLYYYPDVKTKLLHLILTMG